MREASVMRLFLIVRHDDERDAEPLLNVHELELGVLAQFLVERAERLVEQQDLRPLHERGARVRRRWRCPPES